MDPESGRNEMDPIPLEASTLTTPPPGLPISYLQLTIINLATQLKITLFRSKFFRFYSAIKLHINLKHHFVKTVLIIKLFFQELHIRKQRSFEVDQNKILTWKQSQTC